MDLEKYLVERDKKLTKMFQLINKLEPALEFDEKENEQSLESLARGQKAGDGAGSGLTGPSVGEGDVPSSPEGSNII